MATIERVAVTDTAAALAGKRRDFYVYFVKGGVEYDDSPMSTFASAVALFKDVMNGAIKTGTYPFECGVYDVAKDATVMRFIYDWNGAG